MQNVVDCILLLSSGKQGCRSDRAGQSRGLMTQQTFNRRQSNEIKGIASANPTMKPPSFCLPWNQGQLSTLFKFDGGSFDRGAGKSIDVVYGNEAVQTAFC